MRNNAEDQSVPHEISLVENDYVLVHVSGTVTRDDRENTFSKIIETIKRTGVTRVLIDHSNSRLSVTTSESYEFGKTIHKAMSRVGLRDWPRLAVIIPDDDRGRDDKVFAATVASNLGLAIRDFTDRHDGIDYLLADNR